MNIVSCLYISFFNEKKNSKFFFRPKGGTHISFNLKGIVSFITLYCNNFQTVSSNVDKVRSVLLEVFLNHLVQTRASYHVLFSSYACEKWWSGFQLNTLIMGLKIDILIFQWFITDLEPIGKCFFYNTIFSYINPK